MGLRCLLGHDFGEPELEREREEDGNEVVTTVTEVKTCARCGETQVVSENTEVTTMEQLTGEADAASAEAEGAETAPSEATVSDPATGPEHADRNGDPADAGVAVALDDAEAEDDAVILDDDPAGPDDGEPEPGDGTAGVDGSTAEDSTAEDSPANGSTAEDSTADGSTGDAPATAAESDGVETDPGAAVEDDGAELIDDGPSTGNGSDDYALGGSEADGEYAAYPDVETAETGTSDEEDAETDDGVILDEDGESDERRERGAWPEVEENPETGAEPTPWPEQRGEDEGYSAEIDDGEGGESVEFGGGLTPETTADGATDDPDAEYVEPPERDPSGGVVGGDASGERAIDEGVEITRGESPDVGVSTADVTTEYYCPECEMTRDADGNSMRAGDICPECKRGYVDERPI